jgi:uncharacterized OsmC-like protein
MMPPMKSEDLRSLQAPVLTPYWDDVPGARLTLSARGSVAGGAASCEVETGRAPVEAGLHPATGGTGALPSSGDLLLQALVACAGVTLAAVARSMGVVLRRAEVLVEGDLLFRSMAVARDAPVGFTAVRLRFILDTDAPPHQIGELIARTETYCTVLQSLRMPPRVTTAVARGR